MNLCIDKGNSSYKCGIFESDNLIKTFTFNDMSERDLIEIFHTFTIDRCIICSVTEINKELTTKLKKLSKTFIELSHSTDIPIKNDYRTPESLGKDRLAAVIGAFNIMKNNDIMVIDAGTAITYDFIDSAGCYKGGNISPGIDMRFKALHCFTNKLPLVENKEELFMLGKDTETAIRSGVVKGLIFEIEGYINEFRKEFSNLKVIMTGGNSLFFEKKIKEILVERNLVLIGLNRILQYNA